MHSSSEACGVRTIKPHQGQRAKGRSTMSGDPTHECEKRNGVARARRIGVACRRGGPGDDKCPATPTPGNRESNCRALRGRMRVRALVLAPQRFGTLERSRADRTLSNALLVAARKKVTDPKCVIGELEARSDLRSQQIPCGTDTCCMLTQHTNELDSWLTVPHTAR